MINRTMTLEEALHWEPLAELALQRYTIKENDGTMLLESLDQTSVKDVQFVVDLMNVYAEPDSFDVQAFRGYSFSIILDYLRLTHEFYRNSMLPRMELSIESIQKAFEGHPIVVVFQHFFQNYRNELMEHIELEEAKLFPYAEHLYDGKADESFSIGAFKEVHNHDVEDHLEDVLLMIDSEFPEVAKSFACRTFKHQMDHFHLDLQIHHLIEEGVFVEKVRQLEVERRMS